MKTDNVVVKKGAEEMKKCENLNCKKLTKNRRFCSRKCQNKWLHIYCKKNKLALFGITREKRIIIAKKSNITNKKNRTGIYGVTKEQRYINSKKGGDMCKQNGTGFNNSDVQRLLGRKGGLIGGPACIEYMRNNTNCIFKGIYYSNNSEMEFAMNIYYQFKITLVVNKNYQVKVGSKLFDFFILGIFIEPHAINKYFHPNETLESYTKERRKILNENGYRDFPLMVIQYA